MIFGFIFNTVLRVWEGIISELNNLSHIALLQFAMILFARSLILSHCSFLISTGSKSGATNPNEFAPALI